MKRIAHRVVAQAIATAVADTVAHAVRHGHGGLGDARPVFRQGRRGRPLSAQFPAGESVYYCGATHAFAPGYKLEYGAKGEVTGVDSAEPGKRVKVLFRGNKRGVGCYPSDLSRTWPPPKLPGEYEVGDQVTYSGALLELKAQIF